MFFIVFILEPKLLEVLLQPLKMCFKIILIVLPFVYIVPDKTLHLLLEFSLALKDLILALA